MADYTKGNWKDKLSATGERIIYVENENGIEVICRDIRHFNTPIVKAAPAMHEALKAILDNCEFFGDEYSLNDSVRINPTIELAETLQNARGILAEVEGK